MKAWEPLDMQHLEWRRMILECSSAAATVAGGTQIAAPSWVQTVVAKIADKSIVVDGSDYLVVCAAVGSYTLFVAGVVADID